MQDPDRVVDKQAWIQHGCTNKHKHMYRPGYSLSNYLISDDSMQSATQSMTGIRDAVMVTQKVGGR